MCGRKYSHEGLTWEEYCDAMRLIPSVPVSNLQPNYNIAPTHEVPVCITSEGERRIETLRWGLVPHWAKEAKVGYRMINARAETLTEKPSFKPLLKERRCAVIVSGFYEWKREGKEKQAHKIEHASGEPMVMAGLWTENSALDMRTYTVVTTAASEAMAPVHDRMPVILKGDAAIDGWMDGEWDDDAASVMQPYEGDLAIVPVSNDVGNVRNNYPELLEPLSG